MSCVATNVNVDLTPYVFTGFHLHSSDSLGRYQAMGGQTVQCNACRGRGLVICRACFSHYKEDANDIYAIRELMARMPD